MLAVLVYISHQIRSDLSFFLVNVVLVFAQLSYPKQQNKRQKRCKMNRDMDLVHFLAYLCFAQVCV